MIELNWFNRGAIAFQIYFTGALVSSGWEYAPWILGSMAGLLLVKYVVQKFRKSTTDPSVSRMASELPEGAENRRDDGEELGSESVYDTDKRL